MDRNGSSRLFLRWATALLAITLLAVAGAAWLHWGAARPAPATEPALAAATPPPTTPAPATATPPVTATVAATATAAATASLAATSTPPPPAEYVVAEGDTLGAIAARFGVTVEELVALNRLADPDHIAAGAVLRLPAGEATAAPGDAPAAATSAPPAATTAGAEPATASAPSSAAPATGATPVATVGLSYGGRPIEHYVFGDGPAHVAFVGAIHGGYEWNTANLAYEMVAYFQRNPAAVPEAVTLHIIPVANPDGLARVAPDWLSGPIPTPAGVISDTYRGRFNARDVDLNRNWDCNWQPTGLWRDEAVSGGAAPFSEPETAALRDLFLDTPMQAVVFWHSAAGVVLPGACRPATLHAPSRALAEVYGAVSEFPVQQALNYEINGDASDWLTTQGIPSIAVEFSNHSAMEWERNLAGTLAVLDYYAQACAAGCGASDR